MPLFENTDALIDEIRTDCEAAFAEAFPGSFDVVEEFQPDLPIGEGEVTAVPWVWDGIHTGEFADVRPTGNRVEITGVTVLKRGADGIVFHRIVDWHTLYRQIGFLLVCRRPRSPETMDVDTIDIPHGAQA